MSFHNVFDLHLLTFFKNNITKELQKLGIESKTTITGNSVIYVEFESQDDMNLYKVVGNYKENTKIKFFTSGGQRG